MTKSISPIDRYNGIMRYLDQAIDEELALFIEAVQKKLEPESFFAVRERAYKDWRASHVERYVKIQRMFPDRLRPARGRPRKEQLF